MLNDAWKTSSILIMRTLRDVANFLADQNDRTLKSVLTIPVGATFCHIAKHQAIHENAFKLFFGVGCFECMLLFYIFWILSIAHRLIGIRNTSLSTQMAAYLDN